MPQVSVIIPVFNSARLVGLALRSVFAQTFRDFEVIVVDDGSDDEDELSAALAPWHDRIHHTRQSNRGPASARNTGISRASGSLIAFLDADDEWLPDKLAKQVEFFERYPQTGLLHGAVVDDPQPATVALAGPPRPVFCELFHTGFFVKTLTVMVPRQVLDSVGGFDERREIHIEDWDLWLRIAARWPFGYLPEPLARRRPGGWMSSQVERTYAGQALVIEKSRPLCWQACETHRRSPERCEKKRRYVLHRDWGGDRLAAADRRGAREQLGLALTHSLLRPRTAALYFATFVPDPWRARMRSLLAMLRSDDARNPASEVSKGVTDRGTPRAANASSPTADWSLVHDTVYRRLRRRAIAKLHALDDKVSRIGRSRKQVLFDAVSPMSFAMFRPVYERLRLDPRIEFWFTAHGHVWRPQEIYGPLGIAVNVVPAAHAAWMKVDVYVNADFWDMTWLHRRTRRVHLFHGVAGKYGLDAPVDLAPTIAAFDCLMFVNADRRRRYVDTGLVPDDSVKAALVGYPKVDSLVNGSLDRAAIASELELDPRVPTVIYAPTWSPHSSLNSMGEQVIERLAAAGYQVIVKLHDRSYDRRERGSGGVDWARRLARYDSHPLVRVAHGADSSPLLVASDLLISDHSSIAFEFMLLDRPVIVLDSPELLQQSGVNPQKVELLRTAADLVSDPAAVPRAVSSALARPATLSAKRHEVASQLFYRPGTATDRAVSLIYTLLEIPAAADSIASHSKSRTSVESQGVLRVAG